jgi:hypothetical protein
VFFVKFPKLFVFQIGELLYFIDFRKKFIKLRKQFLFETLSQTLQVLCCNFELKVFGL